MTGTVHPSTHRKLCRNRFCTFVHILAESGILKGRRNGSLVAGSIWSGMCWLCIVDIFLGTDCGCFLQCCRHGKKLFPFLCTLNISQPQNVPFILRNGNSFFRPVVSQCRNHFIDIKFPCLSIQCQIQIGCNASLTFISCIYFAERFPLCFGSVFCCSSNYFHDLCFGCCIGHIHFAGC